MGACKPTLGYPSRTAAVMALRGSGLSIQEIGERIGIRAETVSSLECSARRSRRWSDGRGARSIDLKTVLFEADALTALVPHAEKRGVSANEIARRIVDAAIDDGIVDAILDDAQ